MDAIGRWLSGEFQAPAGCPPSGVRGERTKMTQRIILEELVAAYERHNLTVRVGLNPYHLNNYRDAPFACLNRDGKTFPFGGGISIQEIYFFEQMAKYFLRTAYSLSATPLAGARWRYH
jgi:hypothetical protein